MPLLEVNHLRKSFSADRPVLDDLSFHVDEGEVFGLLGPNGAGKTVTMSIVAGLFSPDSGTVTIGGRQHAAGEYDLRRRLGMAPQELAFYPELSGRDNLLFFGRLYGVVGPALSRRVDEILDDVGLKEHADDPAGQYSGGMKRRLNLGIALVHSPTLLILDEPTVGVDPQSRTRLLEEISHLGEQGVTVVYCSHYMEEVETLCRRVAIMDHGRLLACDSVENLLSRLRHELWLHVASTERLPALGNLARIESIPEGDTAVIVSADANEGERLLNERFLKVLQALTEHGISLQRIEVRRPNLERLFIDMTGRQLRD